MTLEYSDTFIFASEVLERTYPWPANFRGNFP